MRNDERRLANHRWFHGDRTMRRSFVDQVWGRDRSMASPNENGPGLYFTSSLREASTYGPYVYEARTRASFRLLPAKAKPTRNLLRDLWVSANAYDKQLFLDNWNTAKPAEALAHYGRQDTAFGAAVTLYGDLIRDADEWIQAMRFAGYDGTIIERKLGGGGTLLHLVVWSPEKLVVAEAEPLPEED